MHHITLKQWFPNWGSRPLRGSRSVSWGVAGLFEEAKVFEEIFNLLERRMTLALYVIRFWGSHMWFRQWETASGQRDVILYGLYIIYYIYIYFPGSPTPRLMLPLGTEWPAYDQSPYAAAAKLPSAHTRRTARGHTVVHGQRPIFHPQSLWNSLQVHDF